MGREPSHRALELFRTALGRAPDEREAFLAQACAGDDALRAEVDRLLVADARASFLKAPVGPATVAAVSGDLNDVMIGREIGRYRIVRRIASGGMGTVYEAIQEQPKRRVALKLMRAGLASDSALRRFVHEAEILAHLRHPAIAQVFEAGSQDGMPYFAMEYIPDAKTITQFADDGKLSTHQRLAMFADVCDAVHHGHQRGIIHRDLKPGNILVDEAGQAKVIDFGVARATDADMTIATLQTDVGQVVGTLRYMSPEQCEGDSAALDTRSDVYALGVVLYELLTGQFPYDMASGSPFEIPRIIRETEPRRPSTISRLLRGDLETIVLKALEKDRARRYQSASDLAADIRRYLRGEAIEARSDSRLHVLRKQVRRYRVPLAVATGFVLLLIVSSIVAWTLYFESQQRLWESYLSQAQARRWSGKPGQRVESLEALRRAAEIRPSLELRNEAVACLALLDVHIQEKWSETFGLQMPHARFDSRFERIVLWERPTGKSVVRRLGESENLLTLAAVDDPIRLNDPCFSRDGKYLVRGMSAGCEVWDIETGQLLTDVEVSTTDAVSFDYSPDDLEVAVGTQSGRILIRDVRSGQTRVLPPTGASAELVRFSPSGNRMSWRTGNEVGIRDAYTGDVLHTLKHPGRVASYAEWSSDGMLLATGCYDWSVRIWDTENGNLRFTLEGHTNVPTRLGFNRTSEVLFSSAWDGTTRLWDPRDGRHLLTMPGTGFLFAADAQELGSYTHEAGARTYCIAQLHGNDAFRSICARPTGARNDKAHGIAVDETGRLAVVGSETGIRFWDLARGKGITYLPIGLTRSVILEPSGAALITVCPRQVLRWPLQIDEQVLRIGPPENILPDMQGNFWLGCISADGGTLVLSMDLNHALAIDLNNPSDRRVIGPHPGMCSVSLSPNNRWLVTGSWKGHDSKVWDFSSGELAHVVPTISNVQAGLSPDGKWLVTSEAEFAIWETETWRPVVRFPHSDYVDLPGAIAFSSDGQFLAAVSKPGEIVLIHLGRRAIMARLECPLHQIPDGIMFTPSGERILSTGAEEHLLHAWDLRVVREKLAAIGLDWDLPPYPPAPSTAQPPPLRAEVDLGALDNPRVSD